MRGNTVRMVRRLLSVSPDHEPLWVRMYVQPYADRWAAMLLGDEVPPPEPGTATGSTFVGANPEDAERTPKTVAIQRANLRRRSPPLTVPVCGRWRPG